MTKQRTCRHCGGEIGPKEADRKGTAHFNPFICMGVLRERAEAAEGEVAELCAQLSRARQLAQGVEYAALGIKNENVVIEHIIEMNSLDEAEAMVGSVSRDNGFLGGRALPPKYGQRGWAAQLFWEVDSPPIVPVLFGLYSSALPDGMNYRILPPGVRAALSQEAPLPQEQPS